MSGTAYLLVSLISAAAVGAWAYGSHPLLGSVRHGLTGAALGVVGSTVILGSMSWCAFAAEAEATEGVLGVAVGCAFAWMFGAGTRAVLTQTRPAQTSDSADPSADTGPADPAAAATSLGVYRLGWWWPWLLLAPTLIVLALFLYWPAIQTFRLSTKLTRFGAPRQADRCLANFSELLVPRPFLVVVLPLTAVAAIWGVGLWHRRSDPQSLGHTIAGLLQPLGAVVLLAALYPVFEGQNGGYRQIYFNTLVVSAGTVALAMAAGLALAYLTFRRIRGITVYRTLLIWPYAISPPVAGILFFMMFNATGGVVAALAARWGIDFPDYTQNALLARLTVVLASVWKLLGYNLLFFLAGLQTVPRAQIEAAAIDGANAWHRFRYIVMPALGPIAFFLLITNLTYSFFDVYGTIDFLTKGAPAGATSVAIYEIIRVGVDNGDLGRGAAQSVVLFLAVIALTAWQFKRSEGRINYGGV